MATRVLEESAQRVSDGVTELLRKQPFFGSLALRLPLRADPSRETLASDGHEIRYSPRWVAATDAHVIETASGATLVLGDMSIQGNIKGLPSLSELMQLSRDNGARRVLVPTANRRQALDLDEDLLEFATFYNDPKATSKGCRA